MNLIIYVNENFEDEAALFDLDKGEVVLMGDDYHDKIIERIEGYLQALNDFDIYKDEVDTEWIDESHELHEKIGFYNENDE